MDVSFLLLLWLPIVFSIWNLITFIRQLRLQPEKRTSKCIEVLALLCGLYYSYLYIGVSEILFVPWNQAIRSTQDYSMLAPAHLPTFFAVTALACAGYVVARFVPLCKQPPLVSVLCIAAMYIGAAVCIIWCIQTREVLLMAFPLNCLLLLAKTAHMLIYQKSRTATPPTGKCTRLSRLLCSCVNWPWLALALMIPLLGIVVILLLLFGQAPDSIVKVWTETAEWTFSQHKPPPRLPYDGHYLCTVAARGHHRLVKPLRIGTRHGHAVLVNRQLCVANAFEQVLQEKLPKAHRALRGFYDKTGYPISRHMHSAYVSDAIYIVMKPLEWFFLAVLYLVDVQPENRIAMQYPHASIPEV